MKKSVVLLILLSLVVVVSTFFVLKSPEFSKLFLSDSEKEALRVGEQMWERHTGHLKDASEGYDIFMIGWGFRSFDQKARWKYKTTPFLASISSMSKIDSKLGLVFLGPKTMPYLGETKEVEVVACNRDNSFLTVEEPQIVAGDVLFFDYVGVGDDLISFCLNPECTKIGKMCKIQRAI